MSMDIFWPSNILVCSVIWHR